MPETPTKLPCHAAPPPCTVNEAIVVSNGPAGLVMSAGLITMSTGVLAGEVSSQPLAALLIGELGKTKRRLPSWISTQMPCVRWA